MTRALLHLIIAFALFVGAAIGYGVWYDLVAGESEHAAELTTEIETQATLQSRATAARAALTKLIGDEAALAQYFVSTDTIVTFLEDLQKRGISSEADVKVMSVSAGTAGTHPSLQVILQISGSFSSVMTTIGRIEYSPYDLSVTGLSLNTSPTDKTSTPHVWSANILLVVGTVTAPPTEQTGNTSAAGNLMLAKFTPL